MNIQFKTIGIIGNGNNPKIADALNTLLVFLASFKLKIFVNHECRHLVKEPCSFVNIEELPSSINLLIVVGGDGSLLNAARTVVNFNIPIVGINQGHLGFLTDIAATDIQESLKSILHGVYQAEARFLLTADIIRKEQILNTNIALNDIVLYSGDIARMLQFTVKVNEDYLYTQRADGIIIATPTGSTAYALSAGGPMVHPKLNAITLVPINPHTLSNRPIVIDGNDEITLQVENTKALKPRLSFDGQVHFTLQENDHIRIKKHHASLILLHPPKYDYFAMLRNKLGLIKQ